VSSETDLPGFAPPKQSPTPEKEPPDRPPAEATSVPPGEEPRRGLRGRLDDLRARGRGQRPLGSPEGGARPGTSRRTTTTRSSPRSSDERRLAVDGLAVLVHGASHVVHVVVRKLTGTARDLTMTAQEAFELAAPLASALEDRVEGSAIAMVVLDRAPELGAAARLVAYGARVFFGYPGGESERQRHRQSVEARLVDADVAQRLAAEREASAARPAGERTYGGLVE
jgi:hypothetical protein